MGNRYTYSYLQTQWRTGTCIQLLTETMANWWSYTVLKRYSGKQVHLQNCLHIQWRTGTCMQLFTDTLVHRYTTSIVIYRDNGKQVHCQWYTIKVHQIVIQFQLQMCWNLSTLIKKAYLTCATKNQMRHINVHQSLPQFVQLQMCLSLSTIIEKAFFSTTTA